MKFTDRIASSLSSLGSTFKSLTKIAVESHRCTISSCERRQPLVILGNGPSLAETITTSSSLLQKLPLMAVNFAGNTPEFLSLKPQYYALADPHFFSGTVDTNVVKLIDTLSHKVDWPMTLFIPAEYAQFNLDNPNITVEKFNPLAVEGAEWLKNWAFGTGRGMPRPRNIMIVAIMCAIKAGFKEIYLTGADHSWLKTLDVSEQNEVISIQPHFYKESESEKKRVSSVYKNVRLHEILLSFHIAFRSYHEIKEYADKHGIKIYNSTPGSFIDAFPRRPLPHINP